MISKGDSISKNISAINDASGKALILLENENHVKDCISWLDEIKGEKQIVALTPFAVYELDKYGLEYNIPEDYYEPEELHQMGLENFKKVEDLCNLIDTEIQLNDNDYSELDIYPAMFSYYHLKIMYDAITICVFQLSKIVNSEKPCAVYFYDSAKYPFGVYESARYLLFNHKESLYSQILLLNIWNIPQKILPSLPQYINEVSGLQKENVSDNLKKRAKQYLCDHPELYDIALTLKKRGFPGFVQWIKNDLRTNKEFPVLLFGAGYNWDDCNEDLRSQGIAPVYRITDDFHWLEEAIRQDSGSLHTAWLNLQINPEFRSFFIMDGIDFYPLVIERLEFLVKQMSIACLFSVRHVMNLIAKKNIKAVIASTFSTCVGHSAAQAAHNSKIPVITWQHGGYGAMEIHPLVNYCDLISSDAHFVFGNGVIDSYLEAAKKYGTELVAVGSTSLESIDNRETIKMEDSKLNNGRNILYVTSSYVQTDKNISVFPPFSDILFWQTQKSIVDILGQHNNYTVTIKLHPSSYDVHPLQYYSIDCGYDHFTFIRREESFTELLQKADAVIIDFPFTTLLQALTTKKPVFAYTGLVHYNENAQRSLSKRAICSRNLDEFLCKLDKYLTDNVYEANLKNNEFLEMYGIASREGTSKKRAPEELNKILGRVPRLLNQSSEL
ncbi:hypothetical protein [Methanosarcina sp. 1.H.T.1A.1]|uniref:hypothetical protein n=1 Tax=Methanosarcina sp. 1.H.T.1A.1 TaxID=1483602 RepID=UPI000AFA397E|nr:hypothetical protein [Methanosarcina sp. 1.H.T.1A.1]